MNVRSDLICGHAMGTFAKGIVVILAIMSVFSLTVAITKLMQIIKSQTATRKFAPQFSRAIQEENLEQAIALAEKNKAEPRRPGAGRGAGRGEAAAARPGHHHRRRHQLGRAGGRARRC